MLASAGTRRSKSLIAVSMITEYLTCTFRQAGDIVAQLKAGIALKTNVIRDGQEQEIEARELVPGDIIILEEGKTIAGDAKVS